MQLEEVKVQLERSRLLNACDKDVSVKGPSFSAIGVVKGGLNLEVKQDIVVSRKVLSRKGLCQTVSNMIP